MILVKEKITDVLLQIGVRTDLLGFGYIADILKICNKDPEALHGGMIRLYKMVGKLHNQPYMNIESRVRSAIEKTFEESDAELLYKLFGSTINKDKAKPTNKQFISTILLYIK